jgi:hypothetical protein
MPTPGKEFQVFTDVALADVPKLVTRRDQLLIEGGFLQSDRLRHAFLGSGNSELG